VSDRLALANAIEDAGIERGKAERVASVIFDAIHDNVATKADVQASEASIRSQLQAAESSIRSQLQTSEATLRSEIAPIRTALVTETAKRIGGRQMQRRHHRPGHVAVLEARAHGAGVLAQIRHSAVPAGSFNTLAKMGARRRFSFRKAS